VPLGVKSRAARVENAAGLRREAVAANRSRTLRWRSCLEQIQQRGGSIEIAITPPGGPADRHLVWRVRLLDVRDDSIVVEQPAALGQVLPVASGSPLAGIITVGQNRWMFATRNLGPSIVELSGGRAIPGLRLQAPDEVERCQRRGHYRVRTTAVQLPDVDVWPLLDPRSVTIAERASELAAGAGVEAAPLEPAPPSEELLPEVGPRFAALLLNLGGGGVGLGLRPEDGQMLLRHKLFWLRIGLPPFLAAPVCASAKLVHVHLEAGQSIYAGMGFDFTFNPPHQDFVAQQICRYLAMQQQGAALRRGA
jgi:hypothetical protein